MCSTLKPCNLFHAYTEKNADFLKCATAKGSFCEQDSVLVVILLNCIHSSWCFMYNVNFLTGY